MKRVTLILSALAVISVSCNNSAEKTSAANAQLTGAEREEIMNTFMATQDAWNAGNLEDFMKGYWESESLVFTGAAGPTYGYSKTLERYKLNYPDQETMGMLKFKVIDLYKIDSSTALMIGQFYLSRSMGDVIGFYTLVWQEIEGRWLIISDHSSGQAIKE